MTGGKADLAKRAGKAEAVKQPERERDDPGRSCGDAGLALASPDDLGSATKAIESAIAASTGLGGTWTKPSVAAGERNAMRDGESRDRYDQLPRVRRNQDESEHEEEMIDAEQDVLDAELEIGSGDRPAALTGRDRRLRRSRRQPLDPFASIDELDPHERVGHGACQTVDAHLLARKRSRSPTGAMSAPWRCQSSAK